VSKNKKNKEERAGKKSSAFLVSVFFIPEYGSDLFLQNIGRVSINHTAYIRRQLSDVVQGEMTSALGSGDICVFGCGSLSFNPGVSKLF
jgi:hypothetical protein